MPFKSEKQKKWMFKYEPKIAKKIAERDGLEVEKFSMQESFRANKMMRRPKKGQSFK